MDNNTQHVDFARMDIKTAESLIGKRADNVEIKNNTVVCTFAGPATDRFCGADTRVHFKKW